jgi:hypothetical protein
MSSKLRGYERLLGNALSLKGIDICWREAQSLKARLDKQLAGQVASVRQQVEVSCAAVVTANRKFEEMHLNTFAGGNEQPGMTCLLGTKLIFSNHAWLLDPLGTKCIVQVAIYIYILVTVGFLSLYILFGGQRL